MNLKKMKKMGKVGKLTSLVLNRPPKVRPKI